MSGPALLCHDKRLPLGDRIGRGGEGEVYDIADGSGRAVKIYLRPDARREAKIGVLVAAGFVETCPNVAFPLDIVRTCDGHFAGFTMQHVRGHQPIHQVMAPGSRRQFFPDANARFLVRVATNAARIVATVHARGVVIGDINSAGFLVSRRATVTLIDADSVQLAGHRCTVGMPEYTPPELQARHFGEVDRTADHDAFGLAVMLFQILFLGRHPFASVSNGQPVALETAIAQARFAYSHIRKVGAVSPPGTLLLSDLPQSIGLLFERAFAPKGGPRPSAADWAHELAILEAGLVVCPESPHHDIAPLAGRCAWCRIEKQTGQPIFRRDGAAASVPALVPETDLHRDASHAIHRARRDASETIVLGWPRAVFTLSKAARQAKTGPDSRALHTSYLDEQTAGAFVARYDAASAAASAAFEDWRRRLGIWDIYKVSDCLRTSLDKLDRLQTHRSALLMGLAAQIVAEKVMLRLRDVSLAAAVITSIGDGLRVQLGRQGLRTAADITRPALSAVAGLGEARTVALLFWRAQAWVEAERAVTGSDTHRTEIANAAAARLDRHVMMLERSIRDTIGDLEQRVARVRKRAAQIDEPVLDALQRRDQAVIDLAHLGIDRNAWAKMVLARSIAPASTAPTKRKSKAGGARPVGQSCPICSGPMVRRWSSSSQRGPAAFLGCGRYPGCNGRRPLRK